MRQLHHLEWPPCLLPCFHHLHCPCVCSLQSADPSVQRWDPPLDILLDMGAAALKRSASSTAAAAANARAAPARPVQGGAYSFRPLASACLSAGGASKEQYRPAARRLKHLRCLAVFTSDASRASQVSGHRRSPSRGKPLVRLRHRHRPHGGRRHRRHRLRRPRRLQLHPGGPPCRTPRRRHLWCPGTRGLRRCACQRHRAAAASHELHHRMAESVDESGDLHQRSDSVCSSQGRWLEMKRQRQEWAERVGRAAGGRGSASQSRPAAPQQQHDDGGDHAI